MCLWVLSRRPGAATERPQAYWPWSERWSPLPWEPRAPHTAVTWAHSPPRPRAGGARSQEALSPATEVTPARHPTGPQQPREGRAQEGKGSGTPPLPLACQLPGVRAGAGTQPRTPLPAAAQQCHQGGLKQARHRSHTKEIGKRCSYLLPVFLPESRSPPHCCWHPSLSFTPG